MQLPIAIKFILRKILTFVIILATIIARGDYMSSFGENLKALRKSRGYTQQRFADVIDSNQATVAAWERETRTPSLSTIKSIANTFKVPLSSLISISETGISEDYISELSDAFEREPKLKILFDRAKYLNEDDLRVIIRIATAFANERIEFGNHL